MPVPTALGFAGQLWLAGHGVGASVGGVLVTIAPLGLSVLFVLLARTVTGFVLRAASGTSLDGTGALKAWALAAVGYGVAAALAKRVAAQYACGCQVAAC